MKNYFKLAAIALCLVAMPHVAKSQAAAKASAAPVAHLDLDSLLKIMPAFTKATDSANAYMTMLQKQLYTMQVEYQRKMNEYDSAQKLWSPLILSLKEKEIQDLETNIQQFQESAQQDFTEKRAAMYEPIFKQVDDAVKAVALAHGYKYVLDSTKGNGVLYATDGPDNIFTEVRVKLNIPEPPKPKPTGTGTTTTGGH